MSTLQRAQPASAAQAAPGSSAPEKQPRAEPGNAARVAARGLGGESTPRPLPAFPHRAEIARLLGCEIDTPAVVDPSGCAAQGAEAFTERGVAHFADANPSLETAAHEATHVLQQSGRSRDAGLGAEGHAEAVESQAGKGRDARGLVGAAGAAVTGKLHHKKKNKPVELLTDISDVEAVAGAVKSSGITKDAEVYVGTFGINEDQADAVHEAGAHYAPMFKANAKKSDVFRARKAKEGEDPEDLQHRALSGPAAFNPVRQKFSEKQRKGKTPEELEKKIPASAWAAAEKAAFAEGQEAGRRMRDKMRNNPAMAEGDTWQLDEVWPSCSKPDVYGPRQIAVTREWIRGIIDGIAHGRKEHQDKLMKGFVHVANPERLIGLGNKGEMKKFWQTMATCTSHMVGEEYPAYKKGGEKAEAEKMAAAVDKLATYGKAGASLAKNYVASYSPGYHLGQLGGNVDKKGDNAFEKDRTAYKKARLEAGDVAGLSEWYFVEENIDGKKGKDRTKRVIAEDRKLLRGMD